MILWDSWAEGFLWGVTWGMKIFGACSAFFIIFLLAMLCLILVSKCCAKPPETNPEAE